MINIRLSDDPVTRSLQLNNGYIGDVGEAIKEFNRTYKTYADIPTLDGYKKMKEMKHTVTEIVKNDNMATLHRVCNGIVYYRIEVDGTLYELEMDSTDADWKATDMYPTFKALNLMRWIRPGIETGKFIQLN